MANKCFKGGAKYLGKSRVRGAAHSSGKKGAKQRGYR